MSKSDGFKKKCAAIKQKEWCGVICDSVFHQKNQRCGVFVIREFHAFPASISLFFTFLKLKTFDLLVNDVKRSRGGSQTGVFRLGCHQQHLLQVRRPEKRCSWVRQPLKNIDMFKASSSSSSSSDNSNLRCDLFSVCGFVVTAFILHTRKLTRNVKIDPWEKEMPLGNHHFQTP